MLYFFFDMWPPTFFVFLGVIGCVDYGATVRKIKKVDIFERNSDLLSRYGSRLIVKKNFLLKWVIDESY